MKFNPWKVSTLVLAGALALVVSQGSVQEASAASQPHMKSAQAMLKSAKEQLQKATSDKGGHRVKAVSLTNDAIDQVQKGIEYDNKNEKK